MQYVNTCNALNAETHSLLTSHHSVSKEELLDTEQLNTPPELLHNLYKIMVKLLKQSIF